MSTHFMAKKQMKYNQKQMREFIEQTIAVQSSTEYKEIVDNQTLENSENSDLMKTVGIDNVIRY